MHRYSVTVKIVKTWYETVEITAGSEDEAELYAEAADIEGTDEPITDIYAHCDGQLDEEPLDLLEEEAILSETCVILSEGVEDAQLPKTSRSSRSRRGRSRKKAEASVTPMEGADELTSDPFAQSGAEVDETIFDVIEDEMIEEALGALSAEVESVQPPRRSRSSRSRRNRARKKAEMSAAPIEGAEHTMSDPFAESGAEVDETFREIPEDQMIEEAPGVLSEEAESVQLPKRSRSSRSRRNRARKKAEAGAPPIEGAEPTNEPSMDSGSSIDAMHLEVIEEAEALGVSPDVPAEETEGVPESGKPRSPRPRRSRPRKKKDSDALPIERAEGLSISQDDDTTVHDAHQDIPDEQAHVDVPLIPSEEAEVAPPPKKPRSSRPRSPRPRKNVEAQAPSVDQQEAAPESDQDTGESLREI